MESSSAVHWQPQSCKFRTPQTAPYISQGPGSVCHTYQKARREAEYGGRGKRQRKLVRAAAGDRPAAALLQGREKPHTHTHTCGGRAERGAGGMGGERTSCDTAGEKYTQASAAVSWASVVGKRSS